MGENMMSMLGGLGAKGSDLGLGASQASASGISSAHRSKKDDVEQVGGDGLYYWQQKGEELQIRCPMEVKTTKKDVSVQFRRSSLKVTVRGNDLLHGNLAGTVDVDDCTWCLAPSGLELQIMLTKQNDSPWAQLLVQSHRANASGRS